MLSPAKAITAGALVFALGGAFLIAQPFSQQSDPPAAHADDVAAGWFTGSVALTSSCSTPEYEAVGTEGLIRHELGYHCEPQTWTASDPRFTGTSSTTWNADVFLVDGEFFTLSAGRYDLQNETGGWICEFDSVAHGYGTGAAQDGDETSTCVGTGGYEGQSAIAILDWDSSPVGMRGFIFSGDGPPLPEPPAAE